MVPREEDRKKERGRCSVSEREQITEPSSGIHLRCKRRHGQVCHEQHDAAVMPAQTSLEDPSQHPSLEEVTHPPRHLLFPYIDSLVTLL